MLIKQSFPKNFPCQLEYTSGYGTKEKKNYKCWILI